MKRKNDISPVDVSMKLVVLFIKICIYKGYLTEEQCEDVLHDMSFPGIKF